MTGMVIGNFTILEKVGTKPHEGYLYRCLCDHKHEFIQSRAKLLKILKREPKQHYCPICIPSGVNNIVGQMFGTVKVLELDHIGDRRITFWKCICTKCNKIDIYSKEQLRSNKFVCSCSNKPFTLDLTGKVFGNLKVVEYAYSTKHKQTKWKCLCNCGSEVIALSTQLTDGSITQCQQCNELQHHILFIQNTKHLIGTNIDGYTVVCYNDQDKHKNHTFKVKCNFCGKIKIVTASQINNNHIHACTCKRGCKDLTNKHYGLLTVVERVGTDTPPKWKCVCECGNQRTYTAAELTTKAKNNSIVSCGCKSHLCGCSWWELSLVKKIVCALGDKYKCQYCRNNMSSKHDQFTLEYYSLDGVKHKYLYDMMIVAPNNKKYIVECQGVKWHPRTLNQLDEFGQMWTNIRGVSGNEIYDNDLRKRLLAEKNGYEVIYVWDDQTDDYNVQCVIDFIQSTQAN